LLQGQSEFGVYSAAPVPGYIERTRDVINTNMKEESSVRDICYHLLRLYCKGYETELLNFILQLVSYLSSVTLFIYVEYFFFFLHNANDFDE